MKKRNWLTILIAVVLVAGAVWAGVSLLGGSGDESPAASPSEATASDPGVPSSGASTPAPGPSNIACASATTTVNSAPELSEALAAAKAGSIINIMPGSYVGHFELSASGTSDAPIILCGSSDSVLDGGGTSKDYVLHLQQVSSVILDGFTVTNGQKGIMLDGTSNSILQNLEVHKIGDEAVHLRSFSTGNTVRNNRIYDTGLRKPQFGEGIYVGTAESNWCDVTDCQPDASDNNQLIENDISGTTAESIDIKEGTSNGLIRGNTFNGANLIEADSWVDVKGNGWLIEKNRGEQSSADGFQTHEILDGWGTDNVFAGNVASDVRGLGFSLKPVRGNVVMCDNEADSAGEGLSNVDCTEE